MKEEKNSEKVEKALCVIPNSYAVGFYRLWKMEAFVRQLLYTQFAYLFFASNISNIMQRKMVKLWLLLVVTKKKPNQRRLDKFFGWISYNVI